MLLIYHLSDIHLRGEQATNSIFKRLHQVPRASFELDLVRQKEVSSVIVVISGDVAHAGLKPEYELARALIDALRTAIADAHGVEPVFLTVAGNHDCDFSKPDPVREELLKNPDPASIAPEIVELCTLGQSAFRAFRQDTSPQPLQSNALLDVHDISISSGQTVRFNLINSAWMSRLREQQAKLVIPVAQLAGAAAKHNCELSVCVFHHPYNWLESTNARNFRTLIETASDLVLTGHEHDGTQHRKLSPTGSQDYIEGAALQPHGDSESSGFNVIAIDFASVTQSFLTAEWDGERYTASQVSASVPLVRDRDAVRRKFPLSKQFLELLEEPGNSYSHPTAKLTLQKIFVYPDLVEAEIQAGPRRKPSTVRDHHVDNLLSRKLVMLMGEEQSGKTALARQLAFDLHRRGIVPVLLHGDRLTKPTPDGIDEWIRKSYNEQYTGASPWLHFVQSERSTKAVIVDDVQALVVNSSTREVICSQLSRMAEFVVVIGNDQWGFDELEAARDGLSTLWSFDRLKILEMGCVKRSEMITRWCNLIDPFATETRDAWNRVTAAEKHIDTVIKNDLLPSYPGNILMLLSLWENGSSGAGTSRTPALLYESMLTSRLQGANVGGAGIDTMYAYMALFAFHLFEKQCRSVGTMEFRTWHQDYCQRFRMNLDSARMVREASAAQILKEQNGMVGFRYPYAYYYFVARHLSKKLKDATIRQIVVDLGQSLHREDASNIMLFLCYLSPEDIVLETVIKAASERFAEHAEFDLSTLPAALFSAEEILEVMPERLLPAQTTADSRRAMRENDDEIAPTEARLRAAEHEELRSLHASLKTIELLGEILRKYPGSIEGDTKRALAEQAYSLALRTIEWWFSTVEEHHAEFSGLLKQLVEKRYGADLPSGETAEAVKLLMFRLSTGWTTHLMRHVSAALGSDALTPTFQEIADHHQQSRASYAAIDLSIKLDLNLSFPREEIRDLATRFTKKPFGMTVLQNLFMIHARLFPVHRADLQFAANKLRVKTAEAERLDTRAKKLPKT